MAGGRGGGKSETAMERMGETALGREKQDGEGASRASFRRVGLRRSEGKGTG
jgi:hypothetical protein